MASDQLLTLLHTSRSISILHVSLPRRPRRTSNTGGTWISTFSPTASLHIINDRPSSDAILTVCFRDRILEEHYISKLHFSWPQVSCVSGYPARGSRTLFVSYQDSACKIQKFALRFPTIYVAETFVNALNETLKDNGEPAPLNSDFRSEISSESEFMSSNRLPTRACEEEASIMAPVDTYIPELPPSFNYEVEQASCTQENKLNRNFEDVSPSFPPSFGSLLANCYSEAKPGVGPAQVQPTIPEEVDLKSHFESRHIPASSPTSESCATKKSIEFVVEKTFLWRKPFHNQRRSSCSNIGIQ